MSATTNLRPSYLAVVAARAEEKAAYKAWRNSSSYDGAYARAWDRVEAAKAATKAAEAALRTAPAWE